MKLKRCLLIMATAVMLLLPSCTAVPNHPPIITILKAEPGAILVSESCRIECIAADEDGDELSYEWSASKGDINGDGATVIWTAPDSEGIYNIAVTVTDGRGGEIVKKNKDTHRNSRDTFFKDKINKNKKDGVGSDIGTELADKKKNKIAVMKKAFYG